MIVDTLLKFREHDLGISIDELVCDIAHSEGKDDRLRLLSEYRRLDKLRHLYRYGINEGWEDFDWIKAHELGWCCVNDYSQFKELEPFREQVEADHQRRCEEQKSATPVVR